MIHLILSLLLSSTALQDGEKLFLENKPREAEVLLQGALLEDPSNENIYLYLGIIYEQLNDPEKAIQILRRGLNIATQKKDVMLFNMAVNYLHLGQLTLAEEMFTKALESNARLESAYLNRANSRLSLQSYKGALDDYIMYLQVYPGTPQRPEIEKIIALLNTFLQEQARLKEAEAQKQKDLLNEVLNSLKNASEDTRNLSAGSEDIEEDYDDIDIHD